jgi:hypothetical protein
MNWRLTNITWMYILKLHAILTIARFKVNFFNRSVTMNVKKIFQTFKSKESNLSPLKLSNQSLQSLQLQDYASRLTCGNSYDQCEGWSGPTHND